MKWLNPVWWWLGIKAAMEFAYKNPLGFTFTWFASGVQTMWTTAFPVSFLHPDWARELVTTVWPVVRDYAAVSWDVLIELWKSST